MAEIQNQHLVQKIKQDGLLETCKFLNTCKVNSMKTSQDTLLKDLDRLFKKYQNLNKNKSRVKGKENLERFMFKPYEFPSTCDSKPEQSAPSHTLSRPFSKCDNLQLKAETYEQISYQLAGELIDLKTEKSKTEEYLGTVIDENSDLNESLEKLNDNLDQKDQVIESQKKNLKRTLNRENYWREKSRKTEENENEYIYNDELIKRVEKLESEKRVFLEQIENLKEENEKLKYEIDQLRKVDNVILYNEKSKSYDLKLHMCVYSLLDNHVAYQNIGPVIESVLKLVGKKANKLPSASTVQNWSVERGILARKQVLHQTVDGENKTLHTDEASKYGFKWGAFATRDSEGKYMLLGLRDMATKSSHDTLETLKEILSDIDTVSNNADSPGQKLLSNIKNTMSDRASTETKFNELLAQYRAEILPNVIENYNLLEENEKVVVSKMNNFFCGLHTLVHMADVSGKSLSEVEKGHFNNDVPIHNNSFSKSGQSGTTRLILTACKAFAKRGDQKNGCHSGFITYIADFLKNNNLRGLPLQPLKGNRFNILFTNAGHVYFLKSEMKNYLDSLPTVNGLLQSVKFDLNESFFVAGCKALGLVSKFISTPLWNVIENKDISISMMNERYLRLINYINDCLQNLDDFILGSMILYDDVPIKKDKVYECLVQQSDYDCHVIVILSVILPALVKLVKHQYGDHLPGGSHEVIDEIHTASVDKHNKYPERVFSYADHILTAKPNITTLALESHIMFSLNKTNEWLAQREDAPQLIQTSRMEVQNERQKFKQREEEIRRKRLQKQQQEFLKRENLERKRIDKLEKDTNDMLFYGLWQSVDQVATELEQIHSKKDQEEALKAQLRFRKNVFKQKCSSSNVYAFSKIKDGKRIPLTVDELKANVLILVSNAYEISTPENSDRHLLVGKKIEHKWLSEGEATWYTGTVISQVPGFPSWFNIKYDNDIALYAVELAKDYEAGDVVVRM